MIQKFVCRTLRRTKRTGRWFRRNEALGIYIAGSHLGTDGVIDGASGMRQLTAHRHRPYNQKIVIFSKLNSSQMRIFEALGADIVVDENTQLNDLVNFCTIS